MKFNNFLLGALFGALVGATVAILMAPSSGEELQENIKSRAVQIRTEVVEAAAQRRADLEAQLAQLRAPSKPTEKSTNL